MLITNINNKDITAIKTIYKQVYLPINIGGKQLLLKSAK